MIGNPVGFVNKLGSGFTELTTETHQGFLMGPGEYVGGFGRGVRGLTTNVVSGSFDFLQNVSGSLYNVLKTVDGSKGAQLKKAENLGDGLFQGVKGGAVELKDGLTGVVNMPV